MIRFNKLQFKNIQPYHFLYQTKISKFPQFGIINQFHSSSINLNKLKKAQVYIDGVTPRQINSLDFLPALSKLTQNNCFDTIKSDYLPKDLPNNFETLDVHFRPKEGGLIVKFQYTPNSTNNEEDPILAEQKDLKEIIENIQSHLDKNFKPNFKTLFTKAKAYRIKGEPFIEDLLLQYPTNIVMVEFQGQDIGMEKLYEQFRPYGKITNISYHEPDVKNHPRYALIRYLNARSAAASRICLHGKVVDGTRMFIGYKQHGYLKILWKWLMDHPRVTIPFLIGALLGIIYTIFDPLRIYNVSSKIQGTYSISTSAISKFINFKSLTDYLKLNELKSILFSKWFDTSINSKLWPEDDEKLKVVANQFKSLPDSILLISGPKGSGKESLVRQSIQDHKNVLELHCKNMIKPRVEDIVPYVAKEFGYFPVFDYLNRMFQFADGLMASAFGKPSGLTSSKEAQLENILDCATIAISRLNGDEDDDVHTYEKGDRPIIVIYDFLNQETKDHPLFERLAIWAGGLIANQLAHIVIVSENPGTSRTLSKWVPNIRQHPLALSDAPLDQVLNIANSRLNLPITPELQQALQSIGGRMSDLDTFFQRVSLGQDPKSAIDEMISRAKTDIDKILEGDKCDPTVAWLVIDELANKETVGYDQIRYSKKFLGSDADLQSLEASETIAVDRFEGKPSIIRPGKPIYLLAFQSLVANPNKSASMKHLIAKAQLTKLDPVIKSIENELQLITNLKTKKPVRWYHLTMLTYWLNLKSFETVPKEVNDRVNILLTKLNKANNEFDMAESEVKKALEVLESLPTN